MWVILIIETFKFDLISKVTEPKVRILKCFLISLMAFYWVTVTKLHRLKQKF